MILLNILFSSIMSFSQILPPQNVTYTPQSDGTSILVKWTDPNPSQSGIEEGGYIIRQESPVPKKLFQSGPNVTQTLLTGFQPSTTYGLKMKSFQWLDDGVAYSGFTNIVSVTTSGAQTGGKLLWNTNISTSATDVGYGITLDATGNTIVTGVNGGGFVSKYSPSHSLLWTKQLTGPTVYARAVAVDSNGYIYVTGDFIGPTDFGGTSLTGIGYYPPNVLNSDIFVAKYDPFDGHLIWVNAFGSSGMTKAYGIVADNTGVYVTGEGSRVYDDRHKTNVCNNILRNGNSVLVFKVDGTTSQCVWAKFPPGVAGSGKSIGINPANGQVYATGNFQTSIDFGGGPIKTNGSNNSSYLVSYKTDGTYMAQKGYGLLHNSQGSGISFDSAGNLYLTGNLVGSIDFGDGVSIPAPGGSANYSIYLAKFTPAMSVLWGKVFGGVGNSEGYGVKVDAAGNAAMVGYFTNSCSFGGSTLTSNGYIDAFVAKFSPQGSHLWSKSFGGPNYDIAQAVGVDSLGNVFTTGYFQGTNVDFGGATMTSQGSLSDGFVTEYAK